MAKKDTKLKNLPKEVEGLDCYVHDTIAADGKETHHTAKRCGKEPEDLCNLNEFNIMSTEWDICLSSTKIDEKSNLKRAINKGLFDISIPWQ